MLSSPKKFWKLVLLIPLLTGFAIGQDYLENDESEESDARVARISFLVGDATINRIDSEDWETVVTNLPIVEGDTIQTERNSKIEIQLDRYNYLHLDGNSVLKLIYLGDDGIAMSLSQGTLGVRLIQFDFDKGYMEIDAPKSTVAIQKNGSYRIDAGDEFNREVRVSVRDDGRARVYSRDSGFVLNDGRTARLFLDGSLAGEWETSSASTLLDGFDSWLQDRNETIARLLADDADKDYYDADIYGADDLNDYGSWTYTSTYGHLWRPYNTSIASYQNWSPYRYGHWRWLPYYGWTWVNDESWGWATYHSGRWIFYRGRWYWSPHRRYHRSGRNWWRPALVFVTYINNSYCWYPLPYGYDYYDYNRRFKRRWNRRRRADRDDRRGRRDDRRRQPDRKRDLPNTRPPLGRVPPGGIVSTPATSFGRLRNGFERPPLGVANKVLRQRPVLANRSPSLPDFDEVKRKLGRRIKAPSPGRKVLNPDTGASTRKSPGPLNKKLEREKIFGNRTPLNRDSKEVKETRTTIRAPRTGAVERKRRTEKPAPVTRRAPKRDGTVYRQPSGNSNDRKTESPRKTKRTPPYVPRSRKPDQKSEPAPRRKSRPVRRPSPPARSTPKRSEPRRSPPARRSPPVRSTPRRSKPKRSPPVRSAPKRSAPKKNSPKPSERPKRKGKPRPQLN